MSIEPGTYHHYKGQDYEVIGTGLHTETREAVVIYKALYELTDLPQDTLFVRPVTQFLEPVTIDEKVMPRFTKL